VVIVAIDSGRLCVSLLVAGGDLWSVMVLNVGLDTLRRNVIDSNLPQFEFLVEGMLRKKEAVDGLGDAVIYKFLVGLSLSVGWGKLR